MGLFNTKVVVEPHYVWIILGVLSFVGVVIKARKTSKNHFQTQKMCDEVHKHVDEKLECLPAIQKSVTQIETKIDIFLEANGKK